MDKTEQTRQGDKARKAHNIIASLILSRGEYTLRDELRHLDAKTRPAHDIIEGGRKAMEALLLSDVISDEQPLIGYARDILIGYIDGALRNAGRDDVTLKGCTHECHTAGGVFVETLHRLYRYGKDIIVEYSDHVPEGSTPVMFYADDLWAFSLDELAEIARSIKKLDKLEKA